MRVLWVVKGLGPGGAERLLVAAGRAHNREGGVHDLDIECAFVLPWKDHLVADLERAGVRTRCLSRRRSDRRWPARLFRLVRSGSYDVVHVHSPLPGSIARLAARSMPATARPAVVSTEHNRWETHRLPTRLLNGLTSRWDDADLAVTDQVRESMRGPARARAITLRHGIDVRAVAARRSSRSRTRAEFGIGDDEFVVGTVANFRPQKDYPNLLAAAAELARREVPVRFLAVGQGPQEAEIRALHASLALGDRFVLTGFRDDAVDVLAGCDAFVLASQWEGLPVAVMEAAALGLPIVATSVGGMAEELTDGVDAVLVPPHDRFALAAAIERVAHDPALQERLATASAGRAASFDVERTVERVEAVYERFGPSPVAAEQADETAKAPRSRRSALAPGVEIRPAERTDRHAIIDLLARSLGSDGDPRYPELFAWKHDHNHFGPSPMWVATEGDRIVAFRAFMRWRFVRGGQALRAVRAVDTATDPEYRGRGLFRTLTTHGLEAVLADGVDFVFNTPNDQSRPGYLAMGWREVGKVPAAVRLIGPSGAAAALRSRVPADRWSVPLDYGISLDEWRRNGGAGARWPVARDVREIRTDLDDDYLVWRFGSPLLGYRVVDDGDDAVIVRARRRGLATELAVVASFGDPVGSDRLAGLVARHAGCSYAIRTGQAHSSSGFVSLPGGGPILTWRAVNDPGFPPLANWALTLGDLELF